MGCWLRDYASVKDRLAIGRHRWLTSTPRRRCRCCCCCCRRRVASAVGRASCSQRSLETPAFCECDGLRRGEKKKATHEKEIFGATPTVSAILSRQRVAREGGEGREQSVRQRNQSCASRAKPVAETWHRHTHIQRENKPGKRFQGDVAVFRSYFSLV